MLGNDRYKITVVAGNETRDVKATFTRDQVKALEDVLHTIFAVRGWPARLESVGPYLQPVHDEMPEGAAPA